MTLSLTVPLTDMEPVTSFLSRVAMRNLCERASSFCADVGLSFRAILQGDEDQIKMLADLAGADYQMLLRYSVKKQDRYKVAVAGETFGKRAFQRSVVRVCPTCVKEGLDVAPWMPARHLSWKLPSVHSCLRHQHRLIQLPPTQFTVDAYDFARRIGHNRDLILAEAASPTDSIPSEFERWIIERLRSGPRETWIDSLPLGVAMRTCEILGTLLRFGSETRLSAVDPAEKQAAGQAGFNVLRDGKAALKDVLLGMVPPENGARQNYSKIYGPFYEWLSDQDGDAGFSPIMDIMRDVITDNYVVRPGMTILGTVIEEQAKFSLHGIKGNFKLGTKRMRDELLARGLAREDPRWPDNVILDRPLDRALIDEISRSIEENINLQEAAQRLGLSEELFRKLVYDGLIPRRGYRQLRNHQYDPIFLDRFLATVTQGAEIIDSIPEDHVLALQAGQIVRARSSEILHLLATRKVPCAGLLHGKTGLAGAIVHLDTLKNAVQTISFSGLTYREMYQKLRVSSPTLRYLLAQGFLTTYTGKNPATLMETEIIPQVSIDAFLQQYVTLGMLAEACGQNANSVRFHLLDAGVEKIPIKHGLGAIYRRKEAEAVLIELGLLPSRSV
ncbi:TniQ family protein [Celeribacter sp. ULVN23_4]